MFMNEIFRRLAIAPLLAGLALLAGCTISSETPLVDDSEGVLVLPAQFVMFPYTESDAGYVPDKVSRGTFTVVANGYLNDDGGPKILLVPAADEGTYLITARGADDEEAMYGLAHVDGRLLVVDMVFDSREIKQALPGITATASDAVASDLAYLDNGLRISRRETLDYLLPFIADGTLPTRPMIAWLGDNAEAVPPKLIRWTGERAEIVPAD